MIFRNIPSSQEGSFLKTWGHQQEAWHKELLEILHRKDAPQFLGPWSQSDVHWLCHVWSQHSELRYPDLTGRRKKLKSAKLYKAAFCQTNRKCSSNCLYMDQVQSKIKTWTQNFGIYWLMQINWCQTVPLRQLFTIGYRV